MSQRRNYGTALLLASLVLGIFLLTGSFIWMQDKANMILAVFVLILYGIGQWMTVVYWQRIQSDWEATGEVLGRLQQAVSDIPAALDSNLKSIATRLTEGQEQALSKLQSEVHSGAMQTLEKGAGLIVESLDKNLKTPLTALEKTLGAWEKQATVQAEATRAFSIELSQGQRDWAEKAKPMAESLAAEFKALAAAGAKSGEAAQIAWAQRATEVQATYENRIQDLQARLIEDVVSRVEGLQLSQTESQAKIVDRALAGLEHQSKQSQEAFTLQTKALSDATANQVSVIAASATAFENGLERMREASLKIATVAEEKAVTMQATLAESIASGHSRLVNEISTLQQHVLGEAGKTLEAQGQLGLEVAGKVSDLADQLRQGSLDARELSHLSQINQTEMQASVAMLNAGLSSILDRLEKQANAGDGYQTLLAELGRTLGSFQDRAGEILIENAMKTQEILMEVLHQNDGGGTNGLRAGKSQSDHAASEALATVS